MPRCRAREVQADAGHGDGEESSLLLDAQIVGLAAFRIENRKGEEAFLESCDEAEDGFDAGVEFPVSLVHKGDGQDRCRIAP